MKKFFQGFLFSSILLLLCVVSWAQNKTISGRVTGDKGMGISQATVLVQGTKIGTSTNERGEFTISVPATATTLVISSVGYGTTLEPINGRTILEVSLKAGTQDLQGVVVTALGIKRETKALGYSVQKVSGEALQKVSGVDVATSLTGKVAGLLVKNSPDFAAVPELTIRGEKPLLVIDGIAYANKTLSDISSEDIESITVLKGATASAIYGFRGGSGALLITTKNGSTGKAGLTIDFATNTMFTAGFLAIPEKQTVYGRGGNNTYDRNSTSSWGTKMDGTNLLQWDPKLQLDKESPYLPVGAKNFSNFLEQGYVTNNNINLGYRKENVAVRSSINWIQNKGQYPNSTLNKYTYSLGADVNLDKFRFGSNLSYSRKASKNIGSNGYTSYDPMYSLLIWSAADYNVLDYKNNYWLKDKEGQAQNFTYGPKSNMNNPYFDRYEKTNEISRDIFNADMSVSYQFTDWLKATLRSGLDFYKEIGQLRVAKGSYLQTGNTPVPGNLYTWNGYLSGAYVIGQTSGYSMNSDLLLTGQKSFGKFGLEYLAGGTIFRTRDDNFNGSTQGGISVPGFYSIKASVSPAFMTQTTFGRQVNSLYGRIGASWNKMVFVEATGRNDWTSTLPDTGRSYFYPSVAASFVISELLPGTRSWLDLLKLRGSWAVTKRPPEIYEINSSFSAVPGTWGTLNGANVPNSLYGTGLLPESAVTMETGIMAMLFKNRLMIDVTYFDKRFYDRLKFATVSAATGYTSNYVNFDEQLSRRGWEVTLSGSPIRNKDWQWDLGANWGTFKRIYTKLDPLYSDVKPWVKVGERYDVLESNAFMRDPSGNLIFNNGRLVYSGFKSKFGYTDPDWMWGVNSSLRYRNFSLYISVDGVVGGIMNTRTESYMWQSGVHPASLTEARAKDVATPGSANFLGQGVKVVSGTATFDQFGNITKDTRVFAPNDVYTTYKQYAIDLHNSSAWGGNGSEADTYSKTFLKLRELSLTYDLPAKFTKGWARAASIGFVGQNVMLWAKDFKYSDPDGGVEDFADPAVRWLGCNIKLTF